MDAGSASDNQHRSVVEKRRRMTEARRAHRNELRCVALEIQKLGVWVALKPESKSVKKRKAVQRGK